MIVVVSTTNGNTPARIAAKAKHIASVQSQKCVAFRHVLIDAAEQDPPKRAGQNHYEAWMAADPSDILCELDADDEFYDEYVLARVAKTYEDPNIWMTYGSFVFSDGRRPVMGAYQTTNYRAAPWLASHLKTFRAALAQKLKPGDMQHADGTWREVSIDRATMLPMLEMSGPEHALHIPDPLVIYHLEHSYEMVGFSGDGPTSVDLHASEARTAEINALPKKERLASL